MEMDRELLLFFSDSFNDIPKPNCPDFFNFLSAINSVVTKEPGIISGFIDSAISGARS
jgi:hypothetical protein